MIWRIVIAVILFFASVAGLLIAGNRLLDFIDKIFDNHN